MRVLLLGATGTIGQATAAALVGAGHAVVAFTRPRAGVGGRLDPAAIGGLLGGVTVRVGDVTDRASVRRDALCGEGFDAIVSCLASRTGAPHDAWAIDHAAHEGVLAEAVAAGIPRFVLLSALCVQTPRLAFQQAKLAFEASLMASGLTWSIVRPTAFFKSLAGQVERVQAGKAFLLFGDGALTACKPISDRDLARFITSCLTEPERANAILPVGGPGPAITPREQGEALFRLTGRAEKFSHVPVAMMDAIIAGLSLGGRVSRRLADKAELARIGRYYATESMLVLDPETGRYSADATPEFGADRLEDHYADLIAGRAQLERGDHAVF